MIFYGLIVLVFSLSPSSIEEFLIESFSSNSRLWIEVDLICDDIIDLIIVLITIL